MKGVLRLTRQIALSAVFFAMTATYAFAGSPKHVIELFTSQGCSSCPTADALLKHYVDRPDVIALSFNVDYWDYLGWKDTLGQRAHTKRQRAYAQSRGDGKVYTPQVIANGLRHAIGSSRSQIDFAIDRSADELGERRAILTLSTDQSAFNIRIAASTEPPVAATVYVAAISPSVSIAIKHGENRGRTITYYNVVRNLIPVGMWSGGETKIKLRRKDILENGAKRCAVLIQAANTGAILAADWMPE